MGSADESRTALILVVDDEAALRMLLREALEHIGFQVCEAVNGVQAIDQLVSRRPDLIIMDVMMPGMDGFTACTRLRESAEGGLVPILIMTALDDPDSIARAYEVGATDFIVKPINMGILSHRVRYMLRASATLTALVRSEARLGLAQRIAKIGNWEWQPSTGRFTASSELCRLIGVDLPAFEGTKEAFLHAVHQDDRGRVTEALREVLEKGKPCNIDHRILLPDGNAHIVNLQAEIVCDDQHKVAMIAGTVQDISVRKRSEEEIHRLAYYDSLTGLPNRALFKDRITQSIAHAHRYQSILAVLFLDLDRFKVVNDMLGHTVGDLLLKQVADRLTDSIRQCDSIGRSLDRDDTHELARLGGDEFTVLLTNIRDPQDAGAVARRILEALGRSFLIDGHEIVVTASVGIAICPTDGNSVDQLLRASDMAMYCAKEEGRNNVQFYSATMNVLAGQRLEMENALRKALERHELVVYFQPQVDIRTNRIVGAEALVRWRHPERGMLLPAAFLPVATETGMIRQLDEEVLFMACRQNKVWQDAGYAPIRTSVNVSNLFFHGVGLKSAVARVLQETQLAAEYLELELTESITMRNVETSIAMLQELRSLGVRLSIDDFGTGYSSLSHLQRFPLSVLKIDQSFTLDVTGNGVSTSITRTIVALGHSMNLRVLAEGVETKQQLALLGSLGCDEAQGYFFSQPMPAEKFVQMLPRTAFGEDIGRVA